MDNVNEKKSGRRSAIGIFILVICLLQFMSWSVWYQMRKGKKLGAWGEVVVSFAKIPTNIANLFRTNDTLVKVTAKSPLLLPNSHFQDVDLKYYTTSKDSGSLLFSSYDTSANQSIVKLLSLCDNKVLYKWCVDFKALRQLKNDPPEKNILDNTMFESIHPMLTKDTGLILKLENDILYKVDKKSKISWVLHGKFHHSIEEDAEGNYWVPCQITSTTLDKKNYPDIVDEGVVQVSPTGKILNTISVSQLMISNGYEALLFGIGAFEVTPLHVNDVQPAVTTTPFWQKDDLLISLRNRSTVIIYRPSSDKIIWLQTGPWLNQHDVNFLDPDKITVFGNDVIRVNKDYKLVRKHNSMYEYCFTDKKHTTPYQMLFNKYNIHTERSGRAKVLDNNELVVEETNYGRIMRMDTEKLIWSYSNIINDSFVGRTSWSRYYPYNPMK